MFNGVGLDRWETASSSLLLPSWRGLVAIRFFKDGEWRDVAIDTLIPCLNGQPVFVRMSDPSEFWMIMLEKAYVPPPLRLPV
eukprot:3221768-Rhodomonas_salina.3